MFLIQLRRLLYQSAIRQSLGLLMVFTVIFGTATAGIYFLVQREIYRLVDARLLTQMDNVQAAIERGQPLPPMIFGQDITRSVDGELQGTDIPMTPPLAEFSDGFHWYDPGHPHLPDLRILIRTSGQDRLVIRESVERQEELLGILAGGLQAALLASLVTAILAGLWAARRSQARIDTINHALEQVAQGHLDTQVNLSGQDDLALLAGRIDATTRRLEQNMEQMRVQSSNIAHDLRTPLARLRALIESRYTALVDKDEAVGADMLETALDQIDRIVGTFDALLRIARIESGAKKASFSEVGLRVVIQRISEAFGPVVEDAGHRLAIDVAEPATIHADLDLIIQLVANLIQNALRYGPKGQIINLTVHGHFLSVSDQGPGIPFGEREKVLEPLYQLERERQSEGAGLGLSLVRAISDLHNAHLSLSDGPQGRGLTVAVRFPK